MLAHGFFRWVLVLGVFASTPLWAEEACGNDGSVYPETLIAPWATAQKGPADVSIDDAGEYVAMAPWYGTVGEVRGGVYGSCGDAIGRRVAVTAPGAKVVMGLSGEFLLAWPSTEYCRWGARPSVWIQVFGRGGTPISAATQVYPDYDCGNAWSEGFITDFYVAADRAGNYIVTWRGIYNMGGGQEFGEAIFRKYDRKGEWLNQELRLDADKMEELGLLGIVGNSCHGLAATGNGDVIFVVPGDDALHVPAVYSYYVWRLNEKLEIQGMPFPVGNTVFGYPYGIMAADANGNVVVAWRWTGYEWMNGTGDIQDRMLAQRFSRDGNKLSEEIAVSGPPMPGSHYGESSPKVAMDAAGNFVVVWWWKKVGLFVGQRFSADGERIGRIFQINVSGAGGYGLVSMNDRGQFAVGYFLGRDPGLQAVGTRVLDLYAKEFIRGDANDSGVVDISDVVTILEYLFLGGTIQPVVQAGDANDDGRVDMSDPIRVVWHLFLGGEYRIPHPYPLWGFDPTY